MCNSDKETNKWSDGSHPSAEGAEIVIASRRRSGAAPTDPPVSRGALRAPSFRDSAGFSDPEVEHGESATDGSMETSRLELDGAFRGPPIATMGPGNGILKTTGKVDREEQLRALLVCARGEEANSEAEKVADPSMQPGRCFSGAIFLSIGLAFLTYSISAFLALTTRKAEVYVPDINALLGKGPKAWQEEDYRGNIRLTSDAFENEKPIPRKYTADGADISPPLSWSNLPPETKSLVLICDAPADYIPNQLQEDWSHWVVYDIPPVLTGLPEGVPPHSIESTYLDAVQNFVDVYQGFNSWGDGSHGYKGPDQSIGSGMHHYVFRIFALDGILGLDPLGATKNAVVKAMVDVNILDYGELVGTYERFYDS